jgi:hypothetical protein
MSEPVSPESRWRVNACTSIARNDDSAGCGLRSPNVRAYISCLAVDVLARAPKNPACATAGHKRSPRQRIEIFSNFDFDVILRLLPRVLFGSSSFVFLPNMSR